MFFFGGGWEPNKKEFNQTSRNSEPMRTHVSSRTNDHLLQPVTLLGARVRVSVDGCRSELMDVDPTFLVGSGGNSKTFMRVRINEKHPSM